MSQNDIDYEDSDDDKYSDYIRFSSHESESEIETNIYAIDDPEPCLDLFTGSLHEALQAAFNSTQIEEHRPIFVHIIRNQNETTLFSKLIIEYLNINYVVWSYDITYDTNRTILNQIWKEIFSVDFFEIFNIDQCPLLIGIRRLFQKKTKTESTYDYQFKIFKNSTSEDLFDELDKFKNDSDKNELGLSFDVSEKTGLPWEIILEITRYLSFNEAVSAFPINIFYLLIKNQSIFKLINPWDPIVDTVLWKINLNQICSIEWNSNQKYDENNVKFVSKFKNVNSITFQNVPKILHEIYHSVQYLPSLTRICLYSDNKIDYYSIILMFYNFQKIRYLEINCPGFIYSINTENKLKQVPVQTLIEYLLLDLRHSKSISPNYYISMAILMRYMKNVKYIRIKINCRHFNMLLSDEEWKKGIEQCLVLEKIIIETYNHIPEIEKYLLYKTQELQRLLQIQKTIHFQIIFH